MTTNDLKSYQENRDNNSTAADRIEWKERIRLKVNEWIDSLSEDIEKETTVPDDLPDLFSFFTVLQSLQSETRTLCRKTAGSLARYGEMLEQRLQTDRMQDTTTVFLPILALFDRIARIRNQLEKPPKIRKLFPDKRWIAFHESISHAMALLSDHIIELMNTMELQRIPTVGDRFNPCHMNAVEVIDRTDLPDNQVVEEIVGGYIWGDTVVRLAEVKVSRNRRQSVDKSTGNDKKPAAAI